MRTCRFCQEPISEQDEICNNCGYNPKTDTLTKGFVRKDKKPARTQNIVSPGIKNFVRWSMVVIIFSLGFKYQSKLGDFIWKLTHPALAAKAASSKVSQNISTRLIDVRSYQAPADKVSASGSRLEGIFYDPQGKSYAVIGGQLFSEGQSAGKMAIKKISRDSVQVIENSQEKLLKVNQ